MSRISLCVIAKNEEAMLADCLESVKGVVDEMIVVDTGSLDRTVEIAEEAGATVVHFAWCDDFSAARNTSLAAATGDWVLILDADERLGPDQAEAIRAAIAADDFDCGMLHLHNAAEMTATIEEVLSGEGRRNEPILLPRLLRRTPDLTYTGRIHEEVAEWITSGKRKIKRVNAHIVHYGYVPSIWDGRNKSERNLRMLEQQVALTPDRPTYRSYLAREQMRAGQNDAAWETIEAGWAMLLEIQKGGGPRPAAVSLASLRAFFQLQQGEHAAAAETCKATLAMGYNHPNLKLFLGAALEQLALAAPMPTQRAEYLKTAAEAYEAALADDGRSFSEEVTPGATSWASGTRLGTIRLLQQRFDDALRAFEEVQGGKPDCDDAVLGRAEALIELGESEEALRSLEPLMALERPDPWLLAGLACQAVGNEESSVLIQRATQLAENSGFLSHHRRAILAEQAVLAGLYKGSVADAPAGWSSLVALMARKPAPGSTLRPSDDKLRQMIASLLRSNRVDLLETLFEPRAETLVPGITTLAYEVLGTFGITPEDDGEPDYIFIGGAGRSGTTLFRAMMAAHPRIHCGPEAKLVPAICSLREQWWSAMGKDLAAAGLDEGILDDATRAFLHTMMAGLGHGAERIAEKTPHNVIHTKTLGRLFPRARFIHVVRDGRAVVGSLLQQNWANPSTGKPLEYTRDAGAAARYWMQVVTAAREQAASVPGRYLEVRYEDLVKDPRAAMERVLAWLGEPWDEAVLKHQSAGVAISMLESSTSQIAHAVHTRSLDKWRDTLTGAQQDQVIAVAGALLFQLRYIEITDTVAMAV